MRLVFVISIYLLSQFSLAQTFEGTVSDKNGAVPFASVLLKNLNGDILSFSTTNEQGEFKLSTKVTCDSVTIRIESIIHEPQSERLSCVDKTSHLKFVLTERTTPLQEVILTQEKPVTIKNDTTTYNLSYFKDGSEKVVEDILKKLPGVKVAENGQITYKDKPIKKFLIEGDDLFDLNYAAGTRNINIESIDKVQAIDNYSENPLLKGIIDADDVVINVTLKKGISDYSGNLTGGHGIKDKYLVGMTGLRISSKSKSFLTASFNNYGINSTPYDFLEDFTSLQARDDRDFSAPKLISEGAFYSPVEGRYHRRNENSFGTFNNIFRFSKTAYLKLIIDGAKDHLKRNNFSKTSYQTSDHQYFEVNEIGKIDKKPSLVNTLITYNKIFKDSTSIEVNSIFKSHSSKTNIASITNGNVQNSDVSSSNIFLKSYFDFSKRIDKRNAILLKAFYVYDDAPQSLGLMPGFSVNDTTLQNNLQNSQRSNFFKRSIGVHAQYFNVNGAFKWKLAGQLNSINTRYHSDFNEVRGSSVVTPEGFRNSMAYNVITPGSSFKMIYNWNKFSVKSIIQANFFAASLEDNINHIDLYLERFIVAPSIAGLYKFSDKSSVEIEYVYDLPRPDERRLFRGSVLSDYRVFRTNEPALSFLKTHSFTLNYSFRNLFKLTQCTLSANYERRENNYFNKTDISFNNIFYSSFYAPIPNDALNFTVSGENYLHIFRTTLQYNVNYNISRDKNIVNESEIRDVTAKNTLLFLKIRPGIKSKKINLENRATLNHSTISAEGFISNTVISISNRTSVFMKFTPQFKAEINGEYLNSDLEMDDEVWFLNSQVSYAIEKLNLEFLLEGRNLLNQTEFFTTTATDYSKSISGHTLIPRYVMLTCTFHF